MAATLDEERRTALLDDVAGMFIDVEFVPNAEFELKSLEDASGIELVNVAELGPQRARATLFVPDGKLGILERKIRAYAPDDPSRSPRSVPLVSSLGSIRRAVAQSFWTDPVAPFPSDDQEHWWEVWIRRGASPERFKRHAGIVNLHLSNRVLKFPDRVVFLARASVATISRSADLLDSIAELRRAVPVDVELIGLDSTTEAEVVESLAERIVRAPVSAPAVCLLDTGVDFEHPLLRAALERSDVHSCFGEDIRDRYGSGDWHGSGSAGLAVFGVELSEALLNQEPWAHRHHLESVKIIPSDGHNDPDLYGEITKEAVARAELAQPGRVRTIVATVTAQQSPEGEPSSWSAAIDQLCAGCDDEERKRRLVVLSAGNVASDETYSYPDSNHLSAVEDPAQAWNALTVGGYTDRETITEPEYSRWSCVAAAGNLSPISRTTMMWEGAAGTPPPFKPDFVCEGGNWARESDRLPPSAIDSLSVLTTKRRDGLATRLLGRFGGTSAAAPIAARMATLVQAAHPQLWPETVRALLVHSCRYTDTMKGLFSDRPARERAEKLLRCFGHGVPDLSRATYSARNELTLVLEREIQPYRIDEEGKARTNEMHLHRLPWPVEVLEGLGELETRLRVTLSYFVEPNPGKRGLTGSDRTQILDAARYPSFGLRFDVTTPGERPEELLARVNAAAPEIEGGSRGSDLKHWWLGSKRTRGSIHSDVWSGSAAKLADKSGVAVYPVNGWWRFRPKDPEICERKARYSLVVSIETDSEDVDVYTAVENLVSVTLTV